MTPKVPDIGHREADKELYSLIRRLHLSYRRASISLQEKIQQYLEQFEKEDEKMRALYDSGEISHEEFLKWRQRKIIDTRQWRDMLEQITYDMTNQNKTATSMIDDTLPGVYAINHNYGTYEAEVGSGIDTTYTMYDKFTVKNLLKDKQDLLPMPRVDIPKDERWNRQHIQSAILQGVLTGESMKDIANRLIHVTSMNEHTAMRNARTAVTGAENAGRVDSYKRAENMGIKMKQVWIATHDGRTRDSHAIMDGEKQDPGKRFSNGCRYPGDPQGAPEEVYNCRCTLVAVVEGADDYNPEDSPSKYLIDQDMTYDEWKKMHGDRYFTKLFEVTYPDLQFDGVDEEIAEEYRKGVRRFCEEFPLQRERLESVTDFRTAWGLSKDTDLIDFTDSHIEWTNVGGIFYPITTQYPNSNISLNGPHIVLYDAEESGKTPISEILSQLVEIRKKNGYHGEENAFWNLGLGIEGIIAHEYGHAIANDCGLYYGQEHYNLLQDIFNRHSREEICRDISIYATTNPEEMLAEAFIAYHEPRLRTPIVNEIMDLVFSLRRDIRNGS